MSDAAVRFMLPDGSQVNGGGLVCRLEKLSKEAQPFMNAFPSYKHSDAFQYVIAKHSTGEKNVVACVAAFKSDDEKVEIAFVRTHKDYERQGLARRALRQRVLCLLEQQLRLLPRLLLSRQLCAARGGGGRAASVRGTERARRRVRSSGALHGARSSRLRMLCTCSERDSARAWRW